MILLWLLVAFTSVEQQIVDSVFDRLDNAYVSKKYPKRLDNALALVPLVIEESGDDLDPFLVAQIIFWESRWDPKARGQARNELGLMQLHGRAWGPKGMFNQTDPRDQIRAGIRWLRQSKQKCKSMLGTINMYGSGRCAPILKFARRRIAIYKRLKRKYENRQIDPNRWKQYQARVRK